MQKQAINGAFMYLNKKFSETTKRSQLLDHCLMSVANFTNQSRRNLTEKYPPALCILLCYFSLPQPEEIKHIDYPGSETEFTLQSIDMVSTSFDTAACICSCHHWMKQWWRRAVPIRPCLHANCCPQNSSLPFL